MPVTSSPESEGKARKVSFEGRGALVGKVKANKVVTLTFPIYQRTGKIDIQGEDYTIIRKGNDVVHIDPPGKYNPLYQREKYRQDEVQWKTVTRFVAENPIVW